MSNQLLASKIVVEEESPSLRSIPTLDTAVLAMLGVTEKGPVNTPTLVQSFDQFVKKFGGYIAASDMTAAVEGFFENGGTNLYVVRIVHYTTITDGTTATSEEATVDLSNATPVATLTVDGKYDGTYANSYKIRVAAATSGVASEFNLSVEDSSGLSLELWPNLTMLTTAARYVETIVNDVNNGSERITVTDLAVVGTTTQRRPANALSAFMAGGNDGLTSLADSDYVGSSAGATGFHALDATDDVTMLAIPGIATSAVQNAAIAYAEVTRSGQIFCVLDPPSGQSASQMITYVNSTAAIGGLSEYAAIYWPQIKVLNPSKTLFGTDDTITIPPSGHIAGMIARNDSAKVGGVWTTPAGTEEGKLFGVLGLETDTVLKEDVRDLVFPQRINPITTMKGFPRYVDGARTLKGGGNFPTVAQRRGVSFAERSIKLGLQFARHKNNNEPLRNTLKRTVFVFLKSQMDVGAFASTIPDEAFFVDFGAALNPATSPNIITGRIGLATVQPAEFIILRFSQDTRAIDALLKG